MTSASRPPRSTLSRGHRPAACSQPTAPPRTPRHPPCPRHRARALGLVPRAPLGLEFPSTACAWSPSPTRSRKGSSPCVAGDTRRRGGTRRGGREGLAAGPPARRCPAVPLCPPQPTSSSLPAAPLPRAPHFSFVSSVLPRQHQARGEAGGGAGDGRARVGASVAPFSPQDPDPCGPPAAPPGDVPAAAQAPCPVSASRALPPGKAPLASVPWSLSSWREAAWAETCLRGTGLPSPIQGKDLVFEVRAGAEAELCHFRPVNPGSPFVSLSSGFSSAKRGLI